ncbi:ubiquinol-cytochrome-c reductase complex assembly factor 4 [Dryobates pubescens]|uniref:ubiquinol-cytochrome-c reductase complex assembly factor 4 n=1 Tax=Dryobates pubescens TaxID=118200 RepID=UPI0023B9C50E|nr:ubiquinol-cytochrome-c reductase complex assembly factor 4 [Dryobates pubescens]
MSWALGRWRAWRLLRLPGPARWLAQRRGAEDAADADPEGEGATPFSVSKASPQVWRVSQSMGSDHGKSWTKVLPLSLLSTGLLLWCVFREETEVDNRLEAIFSGEIVDSLDAAQTSNVPLQPLEK